MGWTKNGEKLIALSTGSRHGEILGLRWQDIEGDIITVRQPIINVKGAQYEVSTPKTRKGIRRIVLDPDTLVLLSQHKKSEREYLGEAWADSGLVFTNELGDLLVPRKFDRVWYELLKKSGLPRIRFDDLRHLHVSLLVQ
jgi:integrase